MLFDQVFDATVTTPSQSEVDLLLLLGDHQHSTRVVLAHDFQDAAYVRQSLDYAQFGRVTATLGANGLADATGVVTAFAHHGSLLDAATGLQFKGNGEGGRWYSPDLGRFVSEDPIQDGTNWFMAYGNDPINQSDPTGLSQQGHPFAKPTSLGNPFVTGANLLYQGAKALAPHVGSVINYASQATSNFVNQAIEARMVTTWASHESILTPSGRSYPGGLSGGRSFDNVSYQDKAAAYRREAALVNQVYGSSFKGEASYETALFHQTEIRSHLASSKERGYQDWLQRQPPTWDKVKLWDNDVVARNVANQIDQGAGIWKAVYVGAGTAIADNVGVSALEDARSGRDFYGNRLTAGERALRGTLGGVQLVGTAVGLKAPVMQAGASVQQVGQSLRLGGGVPTSQQALVSRIDTYARRAELRAWDKGLSGPEAGNYADRYFGKAVGQLNGKLTKAGSDYRVFAQYGRDVAGRRLAPFNRPQGSKFLDAALTNRAETTVFAGWDIRFQGRPYPSWNSAADNVAYVQRFQIQQGFVREISVEASRP